MAYSPFFKRMKRILYQRYRGDKLCAMIRGHKPMSEAEVIVQFLKKIEWRIRANRRLREITLGVWIALTFLTLIKVWDLVSPFNASAIRFFVAAFAPVFFGYALWLFRQKRTFGA